MSWEEEEKEREIKMNQKGKRRRKEEKNVFEQKKGLLVHREEVREWGGPPAPQKEGGNQSLKKRVKENANPTYIHTGCHFILSSLLFL